MNKCFTVILQALCLLFVCGCHSSLVVKEGSTFKDKKSFYVQSPKNQDYAFMRNTADRGKALNGKMVDYIIEVLSERGMVCVNDISAAQVIFTPVWGESLVFEENAHSSTPQAASTLEIQTAFTPNQDWQWRGLSTKNITAHNLSEAKIKEAVDMCLEGFPPEDHPSASDIYKAKQAEEKSKEENPFEHIVVEAPKKAQEKEIAPKAESKKAESANPQAVKKPAKVEQVDKDNPFADIVVENPDAWKKFSIYDDAPESAANIEKREKAAAQKAKQAAEKSGK